MNKRRWLIAIMVGVVMLMAGCSSHFTEGQSYPIIEKRFVPEHEETRYMVHMIGKVPVSTPYQVTISDSWEICIETTEKKQGGGGFEIKYHRKWVDVPPEYYRTVEVGDFHLYK